MWAMWPQRFPAAAPARHHIYGYEMWPHGTGAVYTAVATPDVIGASMTYSISGGADSAQFSINSSSGVVGFKCGLQV